MPVAKRVNASIAQYEQAVWDAVANAVRPRERINLPNWAEKYHRLPRGESEAGPYRLNRTPWIRGVLEVLDPSHPAQEIFVIKAKQTGLTEAGDIWIGYCIHQMPSRMLMVQPTVELAKRHSRTRIKPLINNNPLLASVVSPERSRDGGNTILSKEFPGGELLITGANSAVGLRSLPARFAFPDEIDGYPFDLDEEGAPLDIVRGRLETFGGKAKMFCPSTPTLKGLSKVEEGYDRSNKCLFYVPCPKCSVMQPLIWDGVRWPSGRPEAAEYECASCSRMWKDPERIEATIDGEWKEERPWNSSMPYGFKINGLYSHWRTLGERAILWRDSKTFESKKVFTNQVLAETWEDRGSYETSGESVLKWAERYPAQVPPAVQVLTAGVDVQADRLEIEVLGFSPGSPNEEPWSIEHTILPGDTTGEQVWQDLFKYTGQEFKGLNDKRYWIQAVAVDSNYNQMNALGAIDAFSRKRRGQKWWAVRGAPDASSPVWPSNPQRNNKYKIPLHNVGVSAVKESIMERLKDANTTGIRAIHFPSHYEEWYFDQLTSETRVPINSRGRRQRSTGRARVEWVLRPGKRNEVLDTFVYAWAAFRGICRMGWRFASVPVPQEPTEPEVAADTASADEETAPENAAGERQPVAAAPVPAPKPTQQRRRRQQSRVSSWLGRI